MKNILLAIVIVLVGAVSTSSYAKDVKARKVVVISFTESDTKARMPSSVDERAVVAAQSRHVAQMSALDLAIQNLD
jgi:hypothetical protein